jgi:hypothetical protein
VLSKDMSKRRTRAQKMKSQQNMKVNIPLGNLVEYRLPETSVKSHFENKELNSKHNSEKNDIPTNTANNAYLRLIKKDIIKSLLAVSFILCLEVVLYLLWYKK